VPELWANLPAALTPFVSQMRQEAQPDSIKAVSPTTAWAAYGVDRLALCSMREDDLLWLEMLSLRRAEDDPTEEDHVSKSLREAVVAAMAIKQRACSVGASLR
jgi:hypothetical protein